MVSYCACPTRPSCRRSLHEHRGPSSPSSRGKVESGTRSMRAVKGNLGHSFREKCRELWKKYLRELVGHEA